MRFRTLRGLSVLAMLVGALAVGITAHAAPAAPAVNMAKLCSNGAYVLYMDDNGDQFETEAACAAWTKKHPGQPPIAIDDDPDGHPDQADDVNADAPADDTSDAPVAQSAGKTVLVVVTAPDDAATTTDDDSDDGEG